MLINIHTELIFEFTDFNHWVNKASSNIAGFPATEKIICIDINGNACNQGKDFQFARDNNLFPIKAYRLIRNIENKD